MAKIQDYYVEAKKYYVEANLRPKNTHNEMKNLLIINLLRNTKLIT